MTVYELRSMSAGEILDGALAIYRHQFWSFVTIAVVCEGIPTILNAYVQLGGGWIVHPWLGFLSFVLAALGSLLAAGAIVRAIAAAYLGDVLAPGDALRFALGKIWPLLVAGTAAYLLIVLGALAFLVPGIILACGYSLTAQVVVLEDLPGATDALPRSWHLTKGYKWKALGLGIVVFLLFFLPAMAAGLLVALVPAGQVAIDVVSQLLQMVLYPVFAAVFTLFYYDLRVRKEAFDVELLGQQLGLSETQGW